jgi:hypothetical protein
MIIILIRNWERRRMARYNIKISYRFTLESDEYPDRDKIEAYVVDLHKNNKWDATKFELSHAINTGNASNYDEGIDL